MYKQTDRRFSPIIQDFGCYFMCILYIVEKYYLKRDMTISEIQDIYMQGVAKHDIDPEEWYDDRTVDGCYIRYPVLFIQLVLDYFNLPFDVISCNISTIAHKDCFNILYLVRGEGVHHFVVGTSMSDIEWDPWDGGSRCAKEGRIESVRCIHIGDKK